MTKEILNEAADMILQQAYPFEFEGNEATCIKVMRKVLGDAEVVKRLLTLLFNSNGDLSNELRICSNCGEFMIDGFNCFACGAEAATKGPDMAKALLSEESIKNCIEYDN